MEKTTHYILSPGDITFHHSPCSLLQQIFEFIQGVNQEGNEPEILSLLWIQKTNHKMERIIRNSGVNWTGVSGRSFSWDKIYGQRKYCQLMNGRQHFSYGMFPKTSLPQSVFWEKYLFPFGKECQTMYPSRPETLSYLVNITLF